MNHSTPGLPIHHQPGVHPNPCPLSQWCHPTISSSVIPFSSCPRSFPASGSFPMSQLFASSGQSIGVSASTSVLPMNTQDWSPLRWRKEHKDILITPIAKTTEGLFSIPEHPMCCAMKELRGDKVSILSALEKVHKRVLLVVTVMCNRQINERFLCATVWERIGSTTVT